MADDRMGSERTSWVGRAKPPPADPYWPPVEPVHYVAVYPPTMMAPPRRRRGLTTVLVIVGIFAACCAGGVVLAVGFGGGLKNQSIVGSAPPGLNTTVRDGRFEFVVTAVSCGHAKVGESFVTKTAQGQFCVVDLSVSNIGTEAQNFADGFQKAVGPDGTMYGADTGAGVIANGSGTAWWTVINPGNKITGKMVFDIPKEAQIIKLELHDSPLSGGVTVLLA